MNNPSKGLPDPEDPHLREPIDRVARRVVGAGEHFQYPNKSDERCSPTPFLMRAIPSHSGESFTDFTDAKIGWLTVVGLATKENSAGWAVNADPMLPRKRPVSKNYKGTHPTELKGRETGGARWVCRCVCGMYTLRSSRGIRQQLDNPTWRKYPDTCIQCRTMNIVRRGETYR